MSSTCTTKCDGCGHVFVNDEGRHQIYTYNPMRGSDYCIACWRKNSPIAAHEARIRELEQQHKDDAELVKQLGEKLASAEMREARALERGRELDTMYDGLNEALNIAKVRSHELEQQHKDDAEIVKQLGEKLAASERRANVNAEEYATADRERVDARSRLDLLESNATDLIAARDWSEAQCDEYRSRVADAEVAIHDLLAMLGKKARRKNADRIGDITAVYLVAQDAEYTALTGALDQGDW